MHAYEHIRILSQNPRFIPIYALRVLSIIRQSVPFRIRIRLLSQPSVDRHLKPKVGEAATFDILQHTKIIPQATLAFGS